MSLKWLDFHIQGQKTLFSDYFAEKLKMAKICNFWPKAWSHGLTPLEKRSIFDFLNRCFLSLKWLDFYLQGHRTLCFQLVYWKTKKEKLPKSGPKTMDLPLWKNANFLRFKSIFSSLKWLVFDLESHKTLCFGLFCWKTKKDKISNFWPRTMDLPLSKNAKFSSC